MSENAESFGRWTVGELPPPPRFGLRQWRAMIGPGIVMAGANIGGGEWLMGPEVTALYGGSILWVVNVALLGQVFYNLEIMRYALYCGEPIFVGFFRTPPGPLFWTGLYLAFDFIGLWPYLASNAAVPLAAVVLGHPPSLKDEALVRTLSYVVFLGAYLPILFGGKVYNAIQLCMIVKAVLVFGYLLFINLVWNTQAWGEAFTGLFQFGTIPRELDWPALAAFTAVIGAGGLTNMQFSNYVRDKGWGMGGQVGAIPSAIGGATVTLSHVGKVFPITPESLARWRGWFRHIVREQLIIWAPACVLGAVLPAMLSIGFLERGTQVKGWDGAALTAQGLADRTGIQALWYLTLCCGFMVLGPTQITQMDGMARRWVDVLWTGSRKLLHMEGHKVKHVYYTVLALYGVWGAIALAWLNPEAIIKVVGNFWNLALGFSAFQIVWTNRRLLPREVRPRWFMELGVIYCGVVYLGIFAIVASKKIPEWWQHLFP